MHEVEPRARRVCRCTTVKCQCDDRFLDIALMGPNRSERRKLAKALKKVAKKNRLL